MLLYWLFNAERIGKSYVLHRMELIQGCCRWLEAVAQRILFLGSKTQPTSQLTNSILYLGKKIWTLRNFNLFFWLISSYQLYSHLPSWWDVISSENGSPKASLTGKTCTLEGNQQSPFIHYVRMGYIFNFSWDSVMNHRLSYRLLNFINPDLSIVSGKKVIQNLPERNQRIKQLHLNSTSLPTPCWAAESYLHPCASLWTWSRILRPRRLAESCGTRKNAYNNERRIDLWYHIYIYNYIYTYHGCYAKK